MRIAFVPFVLGILVNGSMDVICPSHPAVNYLAIRTGNTENASGLDLCESLLARIDSSELKDELIRAIAEFTERNTVKLRDLMIRQPQTPTDNPLMRHEPYESFALFNFLMESAEDEPEKEKQLKHAIALHVLDNANTASIDFGFISKYCMDDDPMDMRWDFWPINFGINMDVMKVLSAIADLVPEYSYGVTQFIHRMSRLEVQHFQQIEFIDMMLEVTHTIDPFVRGRRCVLSSPTSMMFGRVIQAMRSAWLLLDAIEGRAITSREFRARIFPVPLEV